ncbi:hypothetical protein, partial [Novosphingobium sp.]|uniref:hypothetical protein n=1 Tax=Novosphingobium sp. TaxID=1874826 RepID=UPI0035B4DAC6
VGGKSVGASIMCHGRTYPVPSGFPGASPDWTDKPGKPSQILRSGSPFTNRYKPGAAPVKVTIWRA